MDDLVPIKDAPAGALPLRFSMGAPLHPPLFCFLSSLFAFLSSFSCFTLYELFIDF
jgi:hypothetical protein